MSLTRSCFKHVTDEEGDEAIQFVLGPCVGASVCLLLLVVAHSRPVPTVQTVNGPVRSSLLQLYRPVYCNCTDQLTAVQTSGS